MDRLLYVAMTGAKQLMQAQRSSRTTWRTSRRRVFARTSRGFEAQPDRRARLPEPHQHGRERASASIARKARSCRPATCSTSRSTATAGWRCRRPTAPKPTRAAVALQRQRARPARNGARRARARRQRPGRDAADTQHRRGGGRHDLDRAAGSRSRDDRADRPHEARESRMRAAREAPRRPRRASTGGGKSRADANVKVVSGFTRDEQRQHGVERMVDMIEFARAVRSRGAHDASRRTRTPRRACRASPSHQLGAVGAAWNLSG